MNVPPAIIVRREGGGDEGHGVQHGVEGHVCRFLIGGHILAPVALAAAAYVPVGQVVHELLKSAASFGNAVVLQIFIHGLHGGGKAGEQPAVHDGKALVIQGVLRGIEIVDVGVHVVCR